MINHTEVSMRSRRFLIAGTLMVLSAAIVFAGKKNANWIDEPFTKWDQKQAAELFSKSAWVQSKSFRGQASGQHGTVADPGGGQATNGAVTGTSGGTLGVDVPEYTFTARFFSAEPVREAYVRMLQLQTHYDQMPADKQKEFDQKMGGILHADFSQEVLVTLTYHSNDPQTQRDMNQWFATQTADTLKQNAYLYTPAGQIELLKYRAAQPGSALGAQFIFPRTFNGEPILQPGASGRVRFQLSWQPQINQTMYIDFKAEDMTYKDQLSY